MSAKKKKLLTEALPRKEEAPKFERQEMIIKRVSVTVHLAWRDLDLVGESRIEKKFRWKTTP